jgi:hypothetical protein
MDAALKPVVTLSPLPTDLGLRGANARRRLANRSRAAFIPSRQACGQALHRQAPVAATSTKRPYCLN